MTKEKEKKGKPLFNWPLYRAKWESGESPNLIASRKNAPSRSAILKRVRKDGWSRDFEELIQTKVTSKVLGLTDGVSLREREECLNKEATKRADVETRHREEPNKIIFLLNSALDVLAGSAANLLIENDQDKKFSIIESRKFAGDDIKNARSAADTMAKIQEMERKSNRLDSRDDNQNSDLIDRITAARFKVFE